MVKKSLKTSEANSKKKRIMKFVLRLPILSILLKLYSSLITQFYESSAFAFLSRYRVDSYVESITRCIPLHGKRKVMFNCSKILYLLNQSLPYSSNGYATRSHGIIRAFKSTSLNMVVYTRAGYPKDAGSVKNIGPTRAFDDVDGVRYHRIENPAFRSYYDKSYIVEAAKAVQAVLEVEQPACVLAASNYHNGLPALIAAREMGLPFIYEVRGFWEITRASRDKVFKGSPGFQVQVALESKTAQEADLVLTLNSGMKAELIRRGVKSDKICLLPNSVEASLFSPLERDKSLARKLNIPDDVPVIGYIGTFVDYEGLDDLSQACALLKKEGIEFRLLLVGDEKPSSSTPSGNITDSIRAYAKQGNFSDWLIMPGRVPFDRVRDYYSLIDIAPFPRKPWDVCELVSPLKPLESMMMAKPVVVSDVGALEDMVKHQETGLLFEKGNMQDLAKSLRELIISADLRRFLGTQARNWAIESRTWEYCVSQIVPAIRYLTEEDQNKCYHDI